MKTILAIIAACTILGSINASAHIAMGGLRGVTSPQVAEPGIVHKTFGKRKRFLARVLLGAVVAGTSLPHAAIGALRQALVRS